MANNYFQFKKFIIHQDKCAMKVCTDACIFGAYLAHEMQPLNTKTILDIGTGTGLLSLMLAQKTTALIDTVEIDAAAFAQAQENILQSAWKEKITIFNNDILQFDSNKKFDYIICNPPFFEGNLKSPNEKKNAAKHDTTLSFAELVHYISLHLNSTGLFAVLIPFDRVNIFITQAQQYHFNLYKKILLRHTLHHPYFRAILIFSRAKTTVLQNEIITIKEAKGNYSTKFIYFLKDYYLHL